MSKRYSICKFPSYLGTPWYTDHRSVARFWGYLRKLTDGGEIRVIDDETKEHILVLD